MASLILPHRWRQQPQAPLLVDWSNPISRGLIVAWNAAAPTFNGASGGLCALHNGIGPGDMPGKSLKFDGTTGSGTARSVRIPWTFGKVAGGGGFSVVSLYQEQTSIGNYRRHLWVHNGGAERVRIFHESTAATLGYRVIDGIGGGVDARISVGSVAGDGVYTIGVGGLWNGASTEPLHFYRDQTYNSTTFSGMTANVADATEIIICNDEGYEPGLVDTALTLAWNRALSQEELRKAVAEPWQFFVPLRRRLYFPSVSAGSVASGSGIVTGAGDARATGASTNAQSSLAIGRADVIAAGASTAAQAGLAFGAGIAVSVGAATFAQSAIALGSAAILGAGASTNAQSAVAVGTAAIEGSTAAITAAVGLALGSAAALSTGAATNAQSALAFGTASALAAYSSTAALAAYARGGGTVTGTPASTWALAAVAVGSGQALGGFLPAGIAQATGLIIGRAHVLGTGRAIQLPDEPLARQTISTDTARIGITPDIDDHERIGPPADVQEKTIQ